MISSNVTLEGGEAKAFRFNAPGGANWVELRLANRVGNPSLAFVPGTGIPWPSVPGYFPNYYGADGDWTSGRKEDASFITLVRPDPTNTFTVKAEYVGSLYADAQATIQIEEKIPAALAYWNGIVAGTLANNQRASYRVVVPPGQIGWRLDLTATNGTPPRSALVKACCLLMTSRRCPLAGRPWCSRRPSSRPASGTSRSKAAARRITSSRATPSCSSGPRGRCPLLARR